MFAATPGHDRRRDATPDTSGLDAPITRYTRRATAQIDDLLVVLVQASGIKHTRIYQER
jgi:hypothetical protein